MEFAVFQKVNVFDSWETGWGAVGGVEFVLHTSVPLGDGRMVLGAGSRGYAFTSPLTSLVHELNLSSKHDLSVC